MERVKIIIFLVIIGLLTSIFLTQIRIIDNQKLQMKQQFHSDFIALVSLFGEDGLNKLGVAKEPKELTLKEGFATGLMLQRFIVAYRMRNAWTTEEWRAIETDIKAAIKGSRLLRTRWEQVRTWYADSERSFLDKIVFSVLTEEEKREILRDRFVNEDQPKK